MGLLDNAMGLCRCPACGQDTRQTMRWFRNVRAALAGAIDARAVGQVPADHGQQPAEETEDRTNADGPEAGGQDGKGRG